MRANFLAAARSSPELNIEGMLRHRSCNVRSSAANTVFTRRHELNHDPEARYGCTHNGCKRAFHRQDLLNRHMERQYVPYHWSCLPDDPLLITSAVNWKCKWRARDAGGLQCSPLRCRHLPAFPRALPWAPTCSTPQHNSRTPCVSKPSSHRISSSTLQTTSPSTGPGWTSSNRSRRDAPRCSRQTSPNPSKTAFSTPTRNHAPRLTLMAPPSHLGRKPVLRSPPPHLPFSNNTRSES